jgi:hypothetical protein
VPLQLSTPSGTLSFDSTLTVLQYSNSNQVTDTISLEKYAKNVGLIYKELTVLIDNNSNLLPDSIPWPQRANDGYIYTMTAIAFKK